MPIVHLPLDHLLSSTHSAESSTRRALSNVSLAVAKSKRVIVVSGAGISCSSGIPVGRVHCLRTIWRAWMTSSVILHCGELGCMLMLEVRIFALQMDFTRL